MKNCSRLLVLSTRAWGWTPSINIFTSAMNSNIFPPKHHRCFRFLFHPIASPFFLSRLFSSLSSLSQWRYVPSRQKSASIDQRSTSRKLVERVSHPAKPFKSYSSFEDFSPILHTRKNARANLFEHVHDISTLFLSLRFSLFSARFPLFSFPLLPARHHGGCHTAWYPPRIAARRVQPDESQECQPSLSKTMTGKFNTTCTRTTFRHARNVKFVLHSTNH